MTISTETSRDAESVPAYLILDTESIPDGRLLAQTKYPGENLSPEQAVANAGRLVKEGGAHAVKLEGGVHSAAAITAITRADIPVMGHVGLTPQSVRRLGGFRIQREAIAAAALLILLLVEEFAAGLVEDTGGEAGRNLLALAGACLST